MFLASLSCGHLLLSNGSGGSGERMSVMRMLRDGRTLMAIATLMYAPVPLEEVSSNHLYILRGFNLSKGLL